jgi:hypothetical protein
MRHIIALLALLGLAAVIPSATAGTKIIGEVNGLKLVRVKTVGIFCPSTTTVIAYDPAKPGTIEGVINHAGGPGVLQSVAQPASIAAGAYLLKPDSTRVTQSGSGNAAATSTSGATAAGGNATGGNGGAGGAGGSAGGPPGLVNNPGHSN